MTPVRRPIRLADLDNERLRQLYHYWRERCPPDGRPMPRAALDPIPLGPLLPYIMLIEVVSVGEAGSFPELRFRLVGDEIEGRYGRSLKGTVISETIPLVKRSDTSHQWSEILTDWTPKYRRGPMGFPNGRRFEAERLLLPLSQDEAPVAFLLGAIFYQPLAAEQEEMQTVAGDLEG